MHRICDICHVIDEAPRHITYHPQGTVPVSQESVAAVLAAGDLSDSERATILADVYDTADERHHMACGWSAGCVYCQEG